MRAHTPEDARDLAVLYALGALRGDEARDFEAHLESGCEICGAEVDSFSAVTADLPLAAATSPGPKLRTRVLDRISDERLADGKMELDGGGLQFVRTARMVWERVGNLEIKLLFRDAERAYSAKLVRMAEGMNYPSHRHADVEELYLLEGDLLVSGVLMRPGDYCRAEPGTIHTDISTRGGCLFISMSSERDELLI